MYLFLERMLLLGLFPIHPDYYSRTFLLHHLLYQRVLKDISCEPEIVLSDYTRTQLRDICAETESQYLVVIQHSSLLTAQCRGWQGLGNINFLTPMSETIYPGTVEAVSGGLLQLVLQNV